MVIFYHGGAFMVGGLDSHDEFCRLLAVHAKVAGAKRGLSADAKFHPLADGTGL